MCKCGVREGFGMGEEQEGRILPSDSDESVLKNGQLLPVMNPRSKVVVPRVVNI
jgi:hypothetical protein